MRRTLRLHREELTEITSAELLVVRGGSTPYATDGHHCQGSTLCVNTLTCLFSACDCPPPNSLTC